MTPKEKAKQLWRKFALKLFPLSNMYIKNACIICVDEIIKANHTFTVYPEPGMVKEDTTDYWKRVKEEIQKIQS